MVAYRLVCTKTHCITGEKSVSRSELFRTEKEAEAKKIEQEEARGSGQYDWEYSIESVPTLPHPR